MITRIVLIFLSFISLHSDELKNNQIELKITTQQETNLTEEDIKNLQTKWGLLNTTDKISEILQEEKEYIVNKNFNLCIKPNDYPLIDLKDDKPIGLIADIFDFIAKTNKINYTVQKFQNYNNFNKAILETNTCDVVLPVKSNQTEYNNIYNSEAVFYSSLASSGNKNSIYFDDYIDLTSHKFYSSNKAQYKSFKNAYPELSIILEENVDKIFEAVTNSPKHHYVALKERIDYLIRSHEYHYDGKEHFKFNGIFKKTDIFKPSIGVSNKHPLLLNIINKTLLANKNEVQAIIQNYSYKDKEIVYEIDYTILAYLLGTAIIIISLLLYYFQRKLVEKTSAVNDALTQVSTVGFLHLKDRKILWVNEKLSDIVGYTQKELIGQDTRIFYKNDEEYKYYGNKNYSILKETGKFQEEISFLTKDRKEIIVSIYANRISSSSSTEIMITVIDITDKKKKEKELISQRQQFKNFIEYLGSNIFAYRHDLNGNLYYLSKNFENIMGLNLEHALGKSYESIVNWDKNSLDIADSEYQLLFKDIVKNTSFIMKFEHPIKKETTYLKINDHGLYDENKNLIGIEGIAEDITYQVKQDKKLEELNSNLETRVYEQTKKLKENLENMNLAQKISKIGSWTYDKVNNPNDVLELSDEMYNIFEIKKGTEFTYKKWLSFVHPDDLNDVNKVYEDYQTIFSEYNSFNHRIITVNKNIKYVNVIWNNEYDRDKNLVHTQGIIQDITKVIEDEKLKDEHEALLIHQDRLAQLGNMVSMIAHQWRQPLNSLSVWQTNLFNIIKNENIDYEKVDMVKKKLSNTIQSLSLTIEDFMNFYKENTNVQTFMLVDSINETIDIIGHSLKNKSCLLNIDIDENLSLKTYKNKFQQVLLALISNAMDELVTSNKDKTKIIDIKSEKTNNKIIIVVRDNGNGIPEVVQDKIFNPYFTTKGNLNGTGLGLYMCKLIIEKNMKGKLYFDTKKGKGTSFIIELND